MCVPILRSIGTKLTKLKNMQKSYVLFYVTWILYNWVFGCHGNTCYVIFIGAFFCMIHLILYVQSMCVPILRSIGTKLTKLENMQKSCFIWRHVTQKRNLYDFQFRCCCSNSGFRVYGDLGLDLCSIFDHTHLAPWAYSTGIYMRSFIRIRPVWMGDMPRLKFWKTSYAL